MIILLLCTKGMLLICHNSPTAKFHGYFNQYMVTSVACLICQHLAMNRFKVGVKSEGYPVKCGRSCDTVVNSHDGLLTHHTSSSCYNTPYMYTLHAFSMEVKNWCGCGMVSVATEVIIARLKSPSKFYLCHVYITMY